jgi:hypothetical protein
MLRERSLGESLSEAVLPRELRELPPELARVDAILDEERFLAPFRRRLTAVIGRPTTPIDTYLRLMASWNRSLRRHRPGSATASNSSTPTAPAPASTPTRTHRLTTPAPTADQPKTAHARATSRLTHLTERLRGEPTP